MVGDIRIVDGKRYICTQDRIDVDDGQVKCFRPIDITEDERRQCIINFMEAGTGMKIRIVD